MTDTDEKNVLRYLDKVYENGLREALKIPEDWRFVDTRLSKTDFSIFVTALGEGTFQMVVGSQAGRESTTVHFTMFISPKGIENLRKWREANDDNVKEG